MHRQTGCILNGELGSTCRFGFSVQISRVGVLMNLMKMRVIAVLAGLAVFCGISGTYVVEPGFRGVLVVLGRVQPSFRPEGFGVKPPFISTLVPVSVRQQTAEEKADCYSSDLQQVHVRLRVLYRIPESGVVSLYRGFHGQPFESLVAPRVHEALKVVTAMQSAEQIVKTREQIKTKALDLARSKVGPMVILEDLVIEDISLSKELGHAIEAKMVQEQEASKSKFLQQRAQIEADTAVIQAKGEAESIRIRGEALRNNPAAMELRVVDKWDGVMPLVVGSAENILINPQDGPRVQRTGTGSKPAQTK
jgi:prohibitin 2